MGAAAKKTIERTMTAHFVIDGPWLCDFARTLWADEDAPEKAINILRTAFPPMEQTDILAVLTGTKKLTGNSDDGIALVADTTTTSPHGNPLDVATVLRKIRTQRDAESDRADDLTQLLLGDTVLLGSPKGAVSVPRRKTICTGTANRPRLKEGVNLERIPHHELPGLSTPRRLYEDRMLGPPQPPKPLPKAEDAITTDCGWLSPDGKFCPCGYSEHVALAYDLCGDGGERELERRNWIKVQNGKFYRVDYEKPPTQRQRDVIFDWAQTKGVKMPWLCREDLETEEAWDDTLDEMAGGRRPKP